MSVLANYQDERKAFAALLEKGCRRRILLVCGKSGCGKTALMSACQSNLPEHVRYVPIQLRETATNVAEIFSRTVLGLGGLENLPCFAGELDALGHASQISLKDIKQDGRGNRISLALQADNPNEREERRVRLTEAWFEDVRDLPDQLLLVIDTYEKATTELKEWIDGPFLARVVGTPAVRVAVAGQEVPDFNNIEWGHCCNHLDLYGVAQAEHWLPVVRTLGRRVPVEPPETYLAGICAVLKGHPGEIMKFIQDTFPCAQ